MRSHLLFILLSQVVYCTAQINKTMINEPFCVPDRLDASISLQTRDIVHKPTIQPDQWTQALMSMHLSEWTQTPKSSLRRTRTSESSRTSMHLSRWTPSPHKSQPSMHSTTQTPIRGSSGYSLVSPARSTTHTIVVVTKTETITNCNTLITHQSTCPTAKKTTVPAPSSDGGRLTMSAWLIMMSLATIFLF